MQLSSRRERPIVGMTAVIGSTDGAAGTGPGYGRAVGTLSGVTEDRTAGSGDAVAQLRLAGHRAALRLMPARCRLADSGAVALTFDDGPDPEFTPQVLDVLAAHRATATFFLVGRRVRRHPELVRRILGAGHAIGSHTFAHRDGRAATWPELARDVWWGRRALEEVAGRSVPAFRPPTGYYGGRVGLAAAVSGVRPWLWTADPADWRPGITAEAIVADLGPLGGGDVVLLHDGIENPLAPEAEDRSATVSALPHIIAAARERGLRLGPIEAGR
jgi:peptidoglycan/xylan/chitin deacetylase (PgdA/CDA1 family)